MRRETGVTLVNRDLLGLMEDLDLMEPRVLKDKEGRQGTVENRVFRVKLEMLDLEEKLV